MKKTPKKTEKGTRKKAYIGVGVLLIGLYIAIQGGIPLSAVGSFDSALIALGNPIGPNPQWPDNVIQVTSECCGDIEGGGRKAVLWDLGAVWQFSQPHIGVDWVKQFFDGNTTLYFQVSQDGKTWRTLWTDTIEAKEPIGTRHSVGKSWLDVYDVRARFVRIYADHGGVLDAHNIYLPVEGPPYHIDQPPLPLPKTVHQPVMYRIMGKQYILLGAPGLLYGQQLYATGHDTTMTKTTTTTNPDGTVTRKVEDIPSTGLGDIWIDKGVRTWVTGPLTIVPAGQEGGYPVNSVSQSLVDLYNAQSIDPDTVQAKEYPKPTAQKVLWEDTKWVGTHGGEWTPAMQELTGVDLAWIQANVQGAGDPVKVEAAWAKFFGGTYEVFLQLHPEKAPVVAPQTPAATTPPLKSVPTIAPAITTPPPKPTPKGIGSFVKDFLEIVRRLISDIIPLSIIGPEQVVPGQTATYIIETEAPRPDREYRDGTYTTQYGYWALVNAGGRIFAQGEPKEVTTSLYKDTAVIQIPAISGAYAVVSIVTKVDSRFVNGQWINGEEMVVSKEAISVSSRVVAEGPPPRVQPKGIGAFLASIWDALMKFLASFRKV